MSSSENIHQLRGSRLKLEQIGNLGERIAIAVEINGSVTNLKGENVKTTRVLWKAKDDDLR